MGLLAQLLAELFIDVKLRKSKALRTAFWMIAAAAVAAYGLAHLL